MNSLVGLYNHDMGSILCKNVFDYNVDLDSFVATSAYFFRIYDS